MLDTPLYGRRSSRGRRLWSDRPAPYAGPTYYGRPAIKPSHYHWLIACYLFAGGIAGASQMLSAVADVCGWKGSRAVVRGGRYLALMGAIVSPIFLVLDLQTPRRWFNMLRIFRATSPMSIGSWTLAAFGTFSGLAAAGQWIGDRWGTAFGRRLARGAGVPAAGTGMLLSCYTGSLLSATSIPFWASASRLLPPLFAASAVSTGTAATSLAADVAGAPDGAHLSMEHVALAASVTEVALTLAAERQWKRAGVDGPLTTPELAWPYRVGVLGLGILVPLVVHATHILTGRRWPWAAKLADVSALAGGFIQRAVLTFAGNASAERPEDYLRFTAPGRDGRQAA